MSFEGMMKALEESNNADSKKSREELMKKYDHNKAACIRALHAEGMSVGKIAKLMDISYQHSFNTVNRKLKKS